MLIKLGNKVRDKISGLVGMVVQKTEHLNGCIQYGVQPRLKKNATEIVTWSIDESQLESLEKPIKIKKSKKRNGGVTLKISQLPLN